MLTLIPGVQSYEWGVPGGAKDSMVADFAECTPELGFQRESSKPYAELWMGTHPTVPSRVVKEDGTRTLLNDVLQEDQALIGSEDLWCIAVSVQSAFHQQGIVDSSTSR